MVQEKSLEDELDEATAIIKRRYIHPIVAQEPEIVDKIELDGIEMNTAFFNLKTHETKISRGFLDAIVSTGLDVATALRGIYQHELGHYVKWPAELSTLLYMSHVAESQWPIEEYGDMYWHILASYDDVVDNLDSLISDQRSADTAALYTAMGKLSGNSIGGRFNKILISLYQKMTDIDLGMTFDDETLVEKLEGKKDDENDNGLMGIDYFAKDEYVHASNLIRFGDILKDVIPHQIEVCINLSQLTNDEINEALSELIGKHSKIVYEMVKDHIKKIKPDFKDNFGQGNNNNTIKGAHYGLGSVDKIQWNDDQVPYYKRLSSNHGLFILKKPILEDSTQLYPHQKREFEIGNDPRKIDHWSSPYIYPGITQEWEEEMGTKTEYKFKIPDKLTLFDTSLSMPHPRYQSMAVLMEFILARNYHANGSSVGIANFSTDMLFVPPTRDLEAVYSAACAYWGGGTVINIPRLHSWMEMLDKTGDKRFKDMEFSTPEDYTKLMEELIPEERSMFEEKSIEVDLSKKPPEIYERIDNFIITDGAIGNMKDVIDYLNSMARLTRNTIFIINNPKEYEDWKKLDLLNTAIHHVENPEDLIGLAIGYAKKVTNNSQNLNYWGG